ncbi:PIR Superfamily Protein [Plasmodium ovale wallikeri]|uniref:PIR Superfamily Protein n=2 Tax=Plasmodium ovale TaxID=36330 RepID=A0A1A9AS82_PLAOA|nr:PIR Superfamily Protein [Plasmodium ovale wallikeri]SBT59083.1 PIR Superfamily Protein [Plasmodium ovale wallikeri]SBT73127.1 PIR protein [Plasmodium ovale]
MFACFAEYPLEKLYNEFNGDVNETYDYYCSSAKDSNYSYNGIYNICKKLVRNLEIISKDTVRNKSGIDLCSYLNYWVSKEVFQIVPSTDTWKYDTIISMLGQPWNDYNYYLQNPSTKCVYPNETIFVNLKNVEKLNELNNYIHNFKYIKEQIKSPYSEYKKCYCMYVSKYNVSYNDLISICDDDKYRNCSKISTDMEIYDPQILLKELQCNESPLSKPELQTDVDLHLPLSGEETVDSKSAENSSFSIFPIFAPIVGVFTVSLILFKLTPLRFLLHKHLIKNKRIEENINDEANSISLESSFEDIDINMSKSPIHLTYQQL